MIGTKLLHYEITARLGEGGMGVVYQATDTRLHREVAIKVLPAAFVEDTERLARFQREAQLLAALNHPNIGGIYGLEEEGSQRFLVLELIPGETLAERLARGAMPFDEALSAGIQIARALEAAHQRGIVHRDLKPANIKLTDDGTVKVLDFGLAKAWDQPAGTEMSHSPTLTAQMTQAGVILGTASYMSPEQARGKPADKRADIWSFGVVLWEMLTGRRLFAGETVSDVLAAVLRAEPPWEDLPPRLPRGVERVLERCLAKDPDERLHDIADARIELGDALAAPSTPGRRSRETGRPASRLRMAALGVMIAVVAAAGSLYVDHRLATSRASTSGSPRLRLDVHLDPELWIQKGLSAASFLAVSPDGRQVVFRGDSATTRLLYVRSLDEIQARPLPGTDGAHCPFFSPDGRHVGFDADKRLKVVALEGGGVRTLCPVENMRGATWTSDGQIVFATGAGDIMRISERGGEPDVLLAADPQSGFFLPRWPLALPGGRHVLLTTLGRGTRSQDRWRIHALSLEDGEHRVLLENAGAARFLPPDRLVFVRGGNDYAQSGNLYVVTIDPETATVAGEDRLVLNGVHLGPDAATPYFDVSTEGDLLYAPTEPSLPARQLVWVDREGKVEPAFPGRSAFEDVRLSPDGSRAVVADRADIWVLDLERGTETRVTSSGGAALPIWTPDGKRVIFEHSNTESGYRLYEADSTGGPARPLSTHRAEFPGFVSPDGRRLMFSRQLTSAQWDLVELDLEDGTTSHDWLATPRLEINARLSPDQRWVVYRLGQKIAVRPYPGPGESTIVSRSGGFEPAWSPDGSEIYYLSLEGMMVVPVKLGKTVSAAPPQLLFDLPDDLYRDGWRAYDVAPDGERFLMILGDPKEVERLRLVYAPGWADELP